MGGFEDFLDQERPRLFLWLPVCLAGGIGAYFSLDHEPGLLLPTVFLVILLGAGLWTRQRYFWLSCGIWAIFFGLAGFEVAGLRTILLETPVVVEKSVPRRIEGRVRDVSRTTAGVARLVLEEVRLPDRLHPTSPGASLRVRLVIRGDVPDILPGDQVRLRAVVMPPPPPGIPGEFDFGRRLWFQKIGAVGYGLGRVAVLARPDERPFSWEHLRLNLSERVRAVLDGKTGGLAAALITGRRDGIPEQVAENMRDAGLAHLLAISGLHMGLFTGAVYFTSRLLFACFPVFALRYPIRKWAALLGLSGGFGYLFISGASIPTVRAYIMVAVVFLGILTDRKAISLRLVALAALLILLVTPEALLSVSFQMSFAAVTALVAVYERWGRTLGQQMRRKNRGPVWRGGYYLFTIILTTLVAELTIGPVALYHFNKIIHLGLLANLVAMPVMALWVMPWIVACLMLMPLGLEALALYPMAAGLDLIMYIAARVAEQPFAVSFQPAIGLPALVLVALGGLWLALWQSRLRLGGGVFLLAGLVLAFLQRPPDILVDNKGRMIGVVTATEGMQLSTLRGSRITRENWARHYGQERAEKWDYTAPAATQSEISCDALSCLYRPQTRQEKNRTRGGNRGRDSFLVALVRDELALAEDCRRADIVISLVAVKTACPRARLVLDKWDFYERGGHAVWLPDRKGGPIKIRTVAGERGRRPWVPGFEAEP